jgi:cytochrome c biogenesis protein CcmG/thiol:disulfide interchange protein DsbE
MELRGRTLAAVAGAFVLAGVLLVVLTRAKRLAPVPSTQNAGQDTIPPIAAGEQAANFTLESLNGDKVTLSALRGKVVFLNIWATWCPPCREEMPSLETLYDEFKNNKNFVMLAVSQDTKGRAAVLPYIQKHGYHFEVLLDPKNKVGEAYNVSGVPETFIIDRNGRIVAHHMGAFNWARPDVREALQELLDSGQG